MRTSIKRFVSVLMVIAMVVSMTFTVSATENEPYLSLNGPATVAHESEFSLTLDCSAADVADGKLTFHYDADGMSFLSAEAGTAWPEEADLSLQVNDNDNGRLVVAFAGAVNAKAGTLLKLTFQAGAELGKVKVELDGENSYLTNDAVLAAAATVELICDAVDFSDVNPEAWYHEGIDYVTTMGYMQGMPGGVFAPNDKTTRAMMVQVLYRMAGAPAVEGKLPFTDVAADAWFHDAILWAYQNKITSGMTATTFEPDASVTREQLAVFFCRFAKLEGLDVSATSDLSVYRDASMVGDYAKDSVKWAVAEGIIKGMPGDVLAPTNPSTRAEIATMMVRFDALEN